MPLRVTTWQIDSACAAKLMLLSMADIDRISINLVLHQEIGGGRRPCSVGGIVAHVGVIACPFFGTLWICSNVTW